MLICCFPGVPLPQTELSTAWPFNWPEEARKRTRNSELLAIWTNFAFGEFRNYLELLNSGNLTIWELFQRYSGNFGDFVHILYMFVRFYRNGLSEHTLQTLDAVFRSFPNGFPMSCLRASLRIAACFARLFSMRPDFSCGATRGQS